ncbi:hypothetical protein EBR04_11545, partial [bacterium]|nr:hypothetical protein [bacterium]
AAALFDWRSVGIGALMSATMETLRNHTIMKWLHAEFLAIPEHWDDLVYKINSNLDLKIMGTSIKDLTIRWETSIVMLATGGLMPDLVLLLDVDLETAARRLDRPLDKLENRGDEYRQRLRSGYLAEAAASPDRIVVIDGTAARDEVASRIRAAVTARFEELKELG